MDVRVSTYLFVLFVGATLTMYYWVKLPRAFKWLGVALTLTLLSEAFINLRSLYQWNLPRSYALFTPLYFSSMIFVYLSMFNKGLLRKLAAVAIVMVLAKGFLELFSVPLDAFPLTSVSFDILILIAVTLLGFRFMFINPTQHALLRNPLFILSAANLIYWSFSFIRLGSLPEYMEVIMNNNLWFEHLHTWLSALYYAVLAYCIYLAAKNHKDVSTV